MKGNQLRNIDLNLLLPLQALLEERSVTRAARRVHLSQSAMSRSLERLRDLFGDELLISFTGTYRLSRRAEHLLEDLHVLLPQISQTISGVPFCPHEVNARVNLAMTDNIATLLLPRLLSVLEADAPQLTIAVKPWHDDAYDSLISGETDLIFSPVAAPRPLMIQRVINDRFVCIVAEDHPFQGDAFTLQEYLAQRHIVFQGQYLRPNVVDRVLSEAGWRREVTLEIPFFSAAVDALENTHLVLTSHDLFAARLLPRNPIRLIKPPVELQAVSYSMVWHPRNHKEPLNSWLRGVVKSLFEAASREMQGKQVLQTSVIESCL